MIFSNQASLTYVNGSVASNAVSGEVVSPLTVRKSASVSAYTRDGSFGYTVTVTNTSQTAYTGLTLTDDLGSFNFNGFPRFPVSYVDGTATLDYYLRAEVVPGVLTVTPAGGGLRFGFDMPASAVAVISFEVSPTVFAPLEAGARIVNTATLDGGAPLLPVSDSFTLPVAERAEPVISKCSEGTATEGRSFTFELTVSNYGNAPLTAGDFATVSDLLDPPLTDITVDGNGVPWTPGNQYEYSDSLNYFRTAYGAVELPAAEFTRDDFGRQLVTPSSFVITITGTVASGAPEQALTDIVAAYADGREANLTVTRVQNDMFRLGGNRTVPAAFMILCNPECTLTLRSGGSSRFMLSGNLLTVDTTGLTGTVTASVHVDYRSGYDIRVDYT